MTAILNDDILRTFRQRRKSGERVSILAAELGLPWQKLDKAIRNGLPGAGRVAVRAVELPMKQLPAAPRTLRPRTQPLTEKYRPQRLCDVVGQEQVVSTLSAFAKSPYPVAMLFEGETGTGKTSAALALAAEIGCAIDQKEFGGVWQIASGDQSADAVRETMERMWQTPFYGSGWRVVIVNECDRISKPAETIWLDRLEALPPRTVVIFTTNYVGSMAARFRDRCLRLKFSSDKAQTIGAAGELLARIWREETGRKPPRDVLRRLTQAAVEGQDISFRRCVQILESHLLAGNAPDQDVSRGNGGKFRSDSENAVKRS